jgi:hypothetical protein
MAAHELGAGLATVILSLVGGAAAVGVAVAIFLWRRGLIGIGGLVLSIGVALAGGAALALLASPFTVGPRAAEPVPEASPTVLAQRADALLARAMAPNSPLACADAVASSQIEEACEGVLFARPETIASAVTYVAAKVALLSEALSQKQADAKRDDPALARLRTSLAADRFGIVAHVLEAFHGCSAETCDAFALVPDPSQLKANLRDSRFDRLVAKHAGAWPAPGGGTSEAGDSPTGASATKPKIDFPSAADIPPVSIMVPEEPSRRSSGGGARRAPKPAAKPRLPARRPAPAAAVPATPAEPAAASPASRANSAGAGRSQ